MLEIITMYEDKQRANEIKSYRAPKI